MDLHDHNGSAVGASQQFFQAPPEEIGQILTAHSTLKAGQKPRLWLRVLLSSLLASPFLGLGFAIYLDGSGGYNVVVGFFIAGMIAFIFGWLLFRFKRSCSYTGTKGVAFYTIKGSLHSKPKLSMFLFEKAVDLRVFNQLQHFHGIYVMEYIFSWYNEQGRKVFSLRGTHTSEKNTPRIDHSFWYALAAEKAWTQYKIPWLEMQLAELGYVPFFSDGKKEVRIGPGFIDFIINDVSTRIPVEEIKTLQIDYDTFEVQNKNAKWLSGKGKYKIETKSLNNACLLAYAVWRFLGQKPAYSLP